jgi:hypothetical protein
VSAESQKGFHRGQSAPPYRGRGHHAHVTPPRLRGRGVHAHRRVHSFTIRLEDAAGKISSTDVLVLRLRGHLGVVLMLRLDDVVLGVREVDDVGGLAGVRGGIEGVRGGHRHEELLNESPTYC